MVFTLSRRVMRRLALAACLAAAAAPALAEGKSPSWPELREDLEHLQDLLIDRLEGLGVELERAARELEERLRKRHERVPDRPPEESPSTQGNESDHPIDI